MDQDTIVDLGSLCESFLGHPSFQDLCDQFDRTTVQTILTTTPSAAKEREDAYFTFQGAQQFIGFMQQLVQAKHDLQAPDDTQDD
jgi:hypothetical protein